MYDKNGNRTGRVTGQLALPITHPKLALWSQRVSNATPFVGMAIDAGTELFGDVNKNMNWTEKAAHASFAVAGSAVKSIACMGVPAACAGATVLWEESKVQLYETLVDKPSEKIGDWLYEKGHGTRWGTALGF